MREAREYSVRGQLSARYIPYYTDSQDYVATDPSRPALHLRYDALGRLLEQSKASGGRITQSYTPGTIAMLDEADNAGGPPRPPSDGQVAFAQRTSDLLLATLFAALTQEFDETRPDNVEEGKRSISLVFNDRNEDMRLVGGGDAILPG